MQGRLKPIIDSSNGRTASRPVFEHNAPLMRAFLFNHPDYGQCENKERRKEYQQLAKSISPHNLERFVSFRVVVVGEDDKAEQFDHNKIVRTEEQKIQIQDELKTYKAYFLGGELYQLGVAWHKTIKTGTGLGDKVGSSVSAASRSLGRFGSLCHRPLGRIATNAAAAAPGPSVRKSRLSSLLS